MHAARFFFLSGFPRGPGFPNHENKNLNSLKLNLTPVCGIPYTYTSYTFTYIHSYECTISSQKYRRQNRTETEWKIKKYIHASYYKFFCGNVDDMMIRYVEGKGK